MRILSSDKKVARIASGAALLGIALTLSYLEAVLPLRFIPLPGFKPGLANIAITVAAFRHSPADAAAISLARTVIMFLLFANPASFIFSLCGSLLVIAALFVLHAHHGRFSFIGISLICALAHNAGQLTAATALVGRAAVSYIPFLILASLVFGVLNGVILNLLPNKIYRQTHERSI